MNNVYMVVSLNKGTPIQTTEYFNPYYRDPQKLTPKFGQPAYLDGSKGSTSRTPSDKMYSCTKKCTTGLPDGPPKALLQNIDILEGHGDLVSRLMMRITGIVIRLIGVINLLPKSP